MPIPTVSGLDAVRAPAPAGPKPEPADAEAAATQRGYRTGYAYAYALAAPEPERAFEMRLCVECGESVLLRRTAAPEPERADAEAAATQRGYRTGYSDALAATAERDAKLRAVLEQVVVQQHGTWTYYRMLEALRLLDAAP